MTHDMAEDKWESIECACVIFDEPPPRFIYIALLRGMREKDMKPWIMFAGTPLGRNAPWMYREIFRPWKFGQDDEIECFFGTTHSNLHNLDPETINRWKKRYSEKELKTRLEGSFEFLSGRIFDTFSREHHVEKDFLSLRIGSVFSPSILIYVKITRQLSSALIRTANSGWSVKLKHPSLVVEPLNSLSTPAKDSTSE